jgi:hypothetical protein
MQSLGWLELSKYTKLKISTLFEDAKDLKNWEDHYEKKIDAVK